MIRSKVLVLTVAAALVAACGDDDGATGTTGAPVDGVEVVVAPALEGIADLLVEAYAAEATDTEVSVVVEEQEALVASLADGRPDLVLAPAVWLTDPALEPVELGRNLAVVVVPEGNPDGIRGVNVFAADAGLATAVCGEESPIGNPSLLVLTAAGVTPDPAAVADGCHAEAAQQVANGELDAALIFRAGVVVPERAETVVLPDEGNLVVELSYVLLGDAADDLADFLAGDTAAQILTENGYLP